MKKAIKMMAGFLERPMNAFFAHDKQKGSNNLFI